ncbi:PTS lactose/cellobiose transporter subunit IIA [Photobacterium sp. DNB23_23_1]
MKEDTKVSSQDDISSYEDKVMDLIVSSGEARSLLFEALSTAKKGNFDDAREMINQAKSSLNKAHLVQTKLIEEDEGLGKLKVSLVMVHAQDHLMNSILVKDLIPEIIQLYELLESPQPQK